MSPCSFVIYAGLSLYKFTKCLSMLCIIQINMHYEYISISRSLCVLVQILYVTQTLICICTHTRTFIYNPKSEKVGTVWKVVISKFTLTCISLQTI